MEKKVCTLLVAATTTKKKGGTVRMIEMLKISTPTGDVAGLTAATADNALVDSLKQLADPTNDTYSHGDYS
eukprot:CAMPEP_0171019294 /NCGR_PEP_ID=MMETSP0736-20130129/28987_1 /TAXON_ID=186038 /ORGANISM="Fragilariopsis kerguelensis, Strain L26-C5" /LENGTH=70 /DNA_ID=CAMNT_0011456383 /DNA_START=525 /DNA_END=737 /DNA_ORIENTATION=-